MLRELISIFQLPKIFCDLAMKAMMYPAFKVVNRLLTSLIHNNVYIIKHSFNENITELLY